ncbi:MAG: hypothetical protein QOD00_308 [Blastocatellia bacterium]|nr:hypothetical protein [Blastocatellia bacterium]
MSEEQATGDGRTEKGRQGNLPDGEEFAARNSHRQDGRGRFGFHPLMRRVRFGLHNSTGTLYPSGPIFATLQFILRTLNRFLTVVTGTRINDFQ